jgi:hypothetical protein
LTGTVMRLLISGYADQIQRPPSGKLCSTVSSDCVSIRKITIPFSKRDCNFIKKSALFESRLLNSNDQEKSRHLNEMRQRASAGFSRTSCLFNGGLWLKLLVENWEQME